MFMSKELNAIKVSDSIEKVHVDFSSIESLNESTGFKRLYLIHTKNTNDMSEQLGFHIGGFCDDRGEGGPRLAADVSGYPYLPSDLILCLMDDKYNYLPLDEKQLDALYKHLTGEDKAEVVEDTIEESVDYDVDDEDTLMEYVLIFKVESKWKKSDDGLNTHYEFCYPLCLNKKPSFPFFNEMFDYIGIDRIRDVVTLALDRGNGKEVINIKLNEDFEFDFAYQAKKEANSYREGRAVLSLRRFNFRDASIPGKLVFENKYIVDAETISDDSASIDNITDDLQVETFIDLESGDSCGIFLIDEEAKFIVVCGLRPGDDEDKQDEFYLPIWLDKENEEYLGFMDKGHLNEFINIVRYEKP